MYYTKLLLAFLASLSLLAACTCETVNQTAQERTTMAQNAGPTYNTFNTQYHFDSYPLSTNTTWEQAYTGSDFEADFHGILSAIAGTLGTIVPPYGSSGKVNADLTNWPDS